MSDQPQVTLTIDGKQITVPAGLTVVDAARRAGVEIPVFCYHPKMEPVGMCRMCLVEIGRPMRDRATGEFLREEDGSVKIQWGRRLETACTARVSEGMVVRTTTEQVTEARKAVLAFLLTSPPLDCPVCAKAGECALQDNYREHDLQPSRLFTRKNHKPKATPLGPTVILDAERCILCTRCVRFCDHVTGTHELTLVQRGDRAEITTFPGVQLDNPYSLNTVDICPVGALTSRDFRFKRRVWFLRGTRSVCVECSRGCNVRVDWYADRVERHVPMYHPAVNQWWMCDHGRLAFHRWHDRAVRAAMDRTTGQERFAESSEVASALARRLQSAEPGRVAVVLSPMLPNEDLWVALALAEATGAALFVGGRTARGESDDFLIEADKNANRRGMQALLGDRACGSWGDLLGAAQQGGFDVVLVLGSEHELPDGWREALGRVGTLAVVGALHTELTAAAHLVLPAAMPAMRNGTVVNSAGRVQRLRRALRLDPPGVVFPTWRYLKRALIALGHEAPGDHEKAGFTEIAGKVEEFAGMTWDGLGDYGLLLGSGGKPDVDEMLAREYIDRCSPQWHSQNVNSRMPWEH